ncbi:tetraacyldisaccharide 4'-kinase [Hippea maritima]|uniref:Tetraacyldisaccharide 4'-kinase n=1 Tax=Hippea maritima (strain ATCC 700847 / DSM 10411 / MH2) TaxID=760142 RepID=F2LXE2_HIPMA|nr:tetraacyldisaccharide 4'-kinase [Hippea maritima]AEA34256.1 Tetraacyldisaccharide 4'-kinase [Hippea maritima DSM 10411]
MNQVKAKKLQTKLKPLLIPFSFIYGTAVNIADSYTLKKTKREFPKQKIISIGNLVVGGVGKTPLAIKLANSLANYGKVCVITNNYPLKDKRVHLVSIDGNIFKKPPKVNDEPYMIALKCPNASVIASKDRIAAIELAVGLNTDFVILDDALHVNNIKKDLEICVFDKDNPFGGGFYLPAGLLRAPKKAIDRCDIKICVSKNKTDKKPPFDCIEANLKIKGVFDSNHNPIDIKDKTVFAFCGIGNPQGFLNTASNTGAQIKDYQFFNDHHQYTAYDLKILEKKKKQSGAEVFITTLKDFVKLEHLKDVCYIDIDLEINLRLVLKEVLDGQKNI